MTKLILIAVLSMASCHKRVTLGTPHINESYSWVERAPGEYIVAIPDHGNRENERRLKLVMKEIGCGISGYRGAICRVEYDTLTRIIVVQKLGK